MIGKYFIELLEGYKYLTSTGQRSKFLIELLGIVEKSSKNYYQMGVAGAFIYAMREPIILTLILILAGFQIYAFDSEISSVLVAILLFYPTCLLSPSTHPADRTRQSWIISEPRG